MQNCRSEQATIGQYAPVAAWAPDSEITEFIAATYVPEPGTSGGKLAVSVSFDGFAGSGAAYFEYQELLGFADRLREYPLDDPHPIAVSSGLFVDEDLVTFNV